VAFSFEVELSSTHSSHVQKTCLISNYAMLLCAIGYVVKITFGWLAVNWWNVRSLISSIESTSCFLLFLLWILVMIILMKRNATFFVVIHMQEPLFWATWLLVEQYYW